MKIHPPGRRLMQAATLAVAAATLAAQAQTTALPDSYGKSSTYVPSYRGYTARDNPYAPGGIYDPYRGNRGSTTAPYSSTHPAGLGADTSLGPVGGGQGAAAAALGGGGQKSKPSINDQAIASGCASGMVYGLGGAGGGLGGMGGMGAGTGIGSSLSGRHAGSAGVPMKGAGMSHGSGRLSHRCGSIAGGSARGAGLGAAAQKGSTLARRQPQP